MEWHQPNQVLTPQLKTSFTILRNLSSEYRGKFANKVIDSQKQHYKAFGDDDFVCNDVSTVIASIDWFQLIHAEYGNPKERDKLFDDIRLKILLGFLKCQVFERKLAAISRLSELGVEKKESQKNQYRRQVLMEANVLDIQFGTQYHEEIVRRSPKFQAFISTAMTSEDLGSILKKSFEHSQEKSSVVCEALAELIENVDNEMLESIFNACKEIPQNKINMKYFSTSFYHDIFHMSIFPFQLKVS